MIDPKRKLWKWGPVDGRILYVDNFMQEMVSCKNHNGISWSDALIHIKDGKVLFVSDYEDLYNEGIKMFEKYVLDEKKCKEVYEKWNSTKDKMVSFIKEHSPDKINSLDNEGMIGAIREFHELYDGFWTYGLIPEIANFGGEAMLKKAVESAYPDKVTHLMEILSAPEDLSFYQIEELDLLKLKIRNKSLEDHQKKYFWLQNSYGSVKIADVQSFEDRMNEVSEDLAKKKIEEIEEFKEKTKTKKKEAIKDFSIPQNIQKIGSRLSFGIWWQDYRKQFIFMALHAVSLFARELGERNNISFEDMLLYHKNDLLKLAEKREKVTDIEARRIGFISYYMADKNSGCTYSGKEANDLIKKYTDIKVDKNIKEIKGVVVSKGSVTGRVKILSGARHFDYFREGEILVTAMTSPDFIVALRKASAIVTDEGGITCHAAIVSRELKIPCIVGTKIATRVLSDGDLVEVNADKGIIKILKKNL